MHNLILGLGSSGSHLIQKYRDEYIDSGELENVCIEGVDSYVTGLDCSDFDRALLIRQLKGVTRVLLVAGAGGKVGAEMIRFTTLHALSENISLHVVLSYPFAWEGRKRREKAIALHHELLVMGVTLAIVDGEEIDDSGLNQVQVLALLDTEMLSEVRLWNRGLATQP